MKSPKKSPSRKPPRTSARSAGQDAVTLLKADHRKVDSLFKKAEKAKGSAKEKLVAQICNELIIHTTIEEEVFYPACRSDDVEEDKLDEAQIEHDGAKVLINELMDAGSDSPMYDAKVKVLSEYIKHHVKEEEQPRTGLFAEAKRKGVDMIALGAKMKARKQELTEQAEGEGLPRPKPKSLQGAEHSPDTVKGSNGSGGMGGRLTHFVEAAKRATVGRNVRMSAKR
jgi:hemerythrin superfamily protein